MDQHTKNNLAIASNVTAFARNREFWRVKTHVDILQFGNRHICVV